MSNDEPTQEERPNTRSHAVGESGVARRQFLAMTGLAAAAAGGWVSDRAAAAPASGYGAGGYGVTEYGGIDATTD